jgi:hypothetical protein
MKQPNSEPKDRSIQFTESDYERLRESALAVSALARLTNQLPADSESSDVMSFATMTSSYLWQFYQEIEERIDKA